MIFKEHGRTKKKPVTALHHAVDVFPVNAIDVFQRTDGRQDARGIDMRRQQKFKADAADRPFFGFIELRNQR